MAVLGAVLGVSVRCDCWGTVWVTATFFAVVTADSLVAPILWNRLLFLLVPIVAVAASSLDFPHFFSNSTNVCCSDRVSVGSSPQCVLVCWPTVVAEGGVGGISRTQGPAGDTNVPTASAGLHITVAGVACFPTLLPPESFI